MKWERDDAHARPGCVTREAPDLDAAMEIARMVVTPFM
jgi:hypothetical protein